MECKHIVITRSLPKTGQVTSYRTGDDGEHEAGWWRGRLNANNKTRFLAKTIGGDDVVIDLVTGLMWAADGNEAGCNSGGALIWNAAIDYGNSLDFAGYTDWRLPNVKELLSIIVYDIREPAVNEPPFANTYNEDYWSSTTYIGVTARAYYVHFVAAAVDVFLKSGSKRLRCVRGGL